jgi:rhodanese-related sulfurtransferase
MKADMMRLTVAVLALSLSACATMQGGKLQRVTVDEVKSALGAEDLTLIDVRDPRAWDASRKKLPGAVREDPFDVTSWADEYPKDARLVFY